PGAECHPLAAFRCTRVVTRLPQALSSPRCPRPPTSPATSRTTREDVMRGACRAVSLLFIGLFLFSGPAHAWDRGRVKTFAVLPAGSSGPEGLEVGPKGHVFVAGFGFIASGPVTGQGQLTEFDEDGRLVRQVTVTPSGAHLLGLRFHPHSGVLLVNDFGAG